MAKGKPTLFKKKGKPTQQQNIELAPRQKINSKSLEDIEKKSEDTGKKKEPRKRQRHPRGYRSLEMYHPLQEEWRKKNQGTVYRSRPLDYATYGCSCGCGKHNRWKVHRRPLRLGGKQKAEIKTPSTCTIGRRW